MSARPDGEFTDRLVFLHGFTQTHHHWHSTALRLGARLGTRPALAFVDLPGHGLSSDDATPISPGAEQVADLCGSGTFIGYSMGGRFALLAALARPDLVERLVLIGATAGLTTDGEREARRSLDDERARRVEALGVDAFVSEWLQGPMFEGLPHDPDGLEHRLRNTVVGLAGSLRSSGTGRQPSVWQQLDRIRVPSLVIAGERDTKFVAIGRDLAAALPMGSLATIPDAGHAAHVEASDATMNCIAEFLTAG